MLRSCAGRCRSARAGIATLASYGSVDHSHVVCHFVLTRRALKWEKMILTTALSGNCIGRDVAATEAHVFAPPYDLPSTRRHNKFGAQTKSCGHEQLLVFA